MLIVAPLGLGTRLVTELTVDLELRGCGRSTVNDKLMRGVARAFTCSLNFGSSSWIRIILLCPLIMNLRVRLLNGKIMSGDI